MKSENAHDAPWYEVAFGELYPIFYAHRDNRSAAGEIQALLDHAGLSAGGRILDLCCGGGRHLAELIRLGLPAVGLDLSPQLLSTASEDAALAGRLVRGDIRHLPFGTVFDGVLNLFSSFGYFQEDRENLQALSEAARVLVPGGRLVLDHMNREKLERTLVPSSRDELPGGTLTQERRLAGDRIQKTLTWTDRDNKTFAYTENVRFYRPAELEAMMQSQGLTVLRIMGNFQGEPFSADSDRMIFIARKNGS